MNTDETEQLKEVNTQDEAQEEPKTDSPEDISSIIEKKVQKALENQKLKYEKELKEQKTLSGLDSETRAKKESENKIAELEEELDRHRLASTKAEISQVLGNRSLDVSLVEFIVTTNDVDECMEKIERLEVIFKKMVKTEVSKKLKSTEPKSANTGKELTLTKENFKKLSLSEQQKLYIENKELYAELYN